MTPPQRTLAAKALASVEKFLAVEASSGIVLIATAVIALVWANSPWQQSYFDLWHFRIGAEFQNLSFHRDLHFLINDGLMTVFFFVVGLEIRREMAGGELSEWRRAVLPLGAAVGGMIVPPLFFLLFNHDQPSARGWGIPIATDIAFAVGVLALLGNRVPPALRILLLALAVIDDVGAILVIAFFYSGSLAPVGFALVALGVALIFAMQRFGARNPWAYLFPGALLWTGAYVAGVHPTLAGVLLGMMTPVRGEGMSPVIRIQNALHRYVAFGIMPLFALSNAGVPLSSITLDGNTLPVFLGVALGLVLGKPIGILGASWLLVRVGVAQLPRDFSWLHVLVVAMVGGIGFTMSIFIAALAFPDGSNLETAKIAVLVGSAIAAVLAYTLGRVLLKPAGNQTPL